MATTAAKPAAFAITEEVKKKLYDVALVIRREALRQMKVEIDPENLLIVQISV